MTSIVLADLGTEHLADLTWAGSPTHRQYLSDAIELSRRGETRVMGGWIDGVLVAHAALDLRAPPVAKLWMLAVHSDHRSRGLGSALVAELEQTALGRGCTVVELSVETHNEGAIALYKRLGYLPVGKTTESWQQSDDGGPVYTYVAQCLVMRKQLDIESERPRR